MSVDSRHEEGSAGSVAIAAYIEAEERGEAPDREEFVRLYPEDETQLRQYWAGLDSFRAKAPIPGLTTPAADADSSELQPTLLAPSDVGDSVTASARGSGVAGALLTEGERQIAAGFDTAWLDVVTGNARARAFYARQGWRDTGPAEMPSPPAGGTK
jgi:GNAT superfamily N-acetyltransferase